MIKSNHRLGYCEICEDLTVVCRKCDCNSCAGPGVIRDPNNPGKLIDCDLCKEALEHQDAYYNGEEISFDV